jgi:hypothetical protein
MIWAGNYLNTGGTSAKSSSMMVSREGDGLVYVETDAGPDKDPEASHKHNTGANYSWSF